MAVIERQTKISFPDLGIELTEGIASGTLLINELIASGNIEFGRAFSNRFEVSLFGIDDNVVGQKIVVSVEENGKESVVFTGYVDSVEQDKEGYYRKIVAYDILAQHLGKNVAEWWTNFWEDKETATLKELRESLLSTYNIPYTSATLTNDNIVITKDVELTSISFSDMLKTICELSGVFPNVNRNGGLEFIELNYMDAPLPNMGDFEEDKSTFEKDTDIKIESVVITNANNEVVATIGEGETYVISQNFLVFNKDENTLMQICESIFEMAIMLNKYNPMDVRFVVSNFKQRLGYVIELQGFHSYILEQTFSGSLLVEQEVIAKGENVKPEVTQPVNLQYADLNGKYTNLRKDVDGLEIEVGEKVSKDDLEEEVSKVVVKPSVITVISNNIDLKGKVTFEDLADGVSEEINSEITDNIYLDGTTTINGGVVDTDTLIAKNVVVHDTNDNVIFDANGNSNYVHMGAFEITNETDSSASYNSFSATTKDGNVKFTPTLLRLDTGSNPSYKTGYKDILQIHNHEMSMSRWNSAWTDRYYQSRMSSEELVFLNQKDTGTAVRTIEMDGKTGSISAKDIKVNGDEVATTTTSQQYTYDMACLQDWLATHDVHDYFYISEGAGDIIRCNGRGFTTTSASGRILWGAYQTSTLSTWLYWTKDNAKRDTTFTNKTEYSNVMVSGDQELYDRTLTIWRMQSGWTSSQTTVITDSNGVVHNLKYKEKDNIKKMIIHLVLVEGKSLDEIQAMASSLYPKMVSVDALLNRVEYVTLGGVNISANTNYEIFVTGCAKKDKITKKIDATLFVVTMRNSASVSVSEVEFPMSKLASALGVNSLTPNRNFDIYPLYIPTSRIGQMFEVSGQNEYTNGYNTYSGSILGLSAFAVNGNRRLYRYYGDNYKYQNITTQNVGTYSTIGNITLHGARWLYVLSGISYT